MLVLRRFDDRAVSWVLSFDHVNRGHLKFTRLLLRLVFIKLLDFVKFCFFVFFLKIWLLSGVSNGFRGSSSSSFSALQLADLGRLLF